MTNEAAQRATPEHGARRSPARGGAGGTGRGMCRCVAHAPWRCRFLGSVLADGDARRSPDFLLASTPLSSTAVC
eukprot:5631841-Prymnesium_polylepis.1